MRTAALGAAALTGLWMAVACSGDTAGTAQGGTNTGGSSGDGGGAGASAGGEAGSSAGAGGSSTAGSAGDGASAGDGGSSAGGASGSGGGSGGSGPPDANVPDVNFNYDAPNIVPEACANQTVSADPVPLDMYVILDTSGSMGGGNCPVTDPNPTTKLCRAVKALYGYAASPDAVGNGMALQEFNTVSGCNPRSTPAVEMAALPSHLAAIQTWLQTRTSGGGTHTEGALLGLRDYTDPAVAPNPPAGFGQAAGRLIIGILITDGNPEGFCNNNVDSLGTIIDNHFGATGIATYVIGMTGAGYANVENLADGAGSPPHSNFCGTTPPCHHYDVGAGDPQPFIDAMKAIQKSAIGCTFGYPNPPSGLPDPDSLDVKYLAGGVPPPQSVPRVANAGACGPTGGFYVDNPIAPTTIDLCPATCAAIQSDQAAKIEVEIDCQGA